MPCVASHLLRHIYAYICWCIYVYQHDACICWCWYTSFASSLLFIHPIPRGVTFSNAVSKLKAQSANVSFHWNVAKETFELWVLSFRKCHPKWDWLYIHMLMHTWCIHMLMHICLSTWCIHMLIDVICSKWLVHGHICRYTSRVSSRLSMCIHTYVDTYMYIYMLIHIHVCWMIHVCVWTYRSDWIQVTCWYIYVDIYVST